MKYSHFWTMLLLFIFCFASCTVEEDKLVNEPLNLTQATASSTDVSSISPSSEIIDAIKQEITNSEVLLAEYNDFLPTYGEFFWNKATYQPAEDGRSITCIPSEKNDQLTGMMLAFQHDGHMDFSFIDLGWVMHVIQNDEVVDDFDFLATIFSLQNMMYYRYRYIHPDLDDYIKNYLETNQIEFRNVAYAVKWRVTVTDPSGTIQHEYTEIRWHTRPCGGSGSGGFTGPIFTNGPPSTTGFLPSDGEPDKWKFKTLVVHDDETDIEDIAACADYAICNDLFNHINNISGNYLIDSCNNTTANDLVIDILTELCDNNIGDNTGISIEGSENTPKVVCDQEEFDEMFGQAMADSDCALFPLSCETFQFVDAGTFFQAAVTGLSANFLNATNGQIEPCPLEFAVNFPDEGFDIMGGGIYINTGQMQNVTADAYNETIKEVTSIYGEIFSNGGTVDCDYLEDEFAEIMNEKILEIFNEQYDVASWSPEDPYIDLGFEETQFTEPSLPNYDLNYFFGGKDNCE